MFCFFEEYYLKKWSYYTIFCPLSGDAKRSRGAQTTCTRIPERRGMYN